MDIDSQSVPLKPNEIPLGMRPEAKPHWFNRETAREMSRKAWDKRREKAKALQEAMERDRVATPQSVQLSKQLRQIEELMDGEKDADTLQKLSAAHARLFSAWQVLTGTPNPGSRKANGKGRSVAPAINPEPAPQSPETQ